MAVGGREDPVLLEHLGGLLEDRRGHGQPKRLGGLEVDDEVKGGRLLDREVTGVGALQYPVHVGGGPPDDRLAVRPAIRGWAER